MSQLSGLAGEVRMLSSHAGRLEAAYRSYVPELHRIASSLAVRSRGSDAAGLLMQAASAVEAAAKQLEQAAAQTSTAKARAAAYAAFLASSGGGGQGGVAGAVGAAAVAGALAGGSPKTSGFPASVAPAWAGDLVAPTESDKQMMAVAAEWSMGGSKDALRDPALFAPYINRNRTRTQDELATVSDPWRINCGECVLAAARTIEGHPTAAGGIRSTAGRRGIRDNEMAAALGHQPRVVGSSGNPNTTWAAEVAATLDAQTEGSYSIVSVGWRGGAGHFFMAYRGPDGTRWLDPQTGDYGRWPPPYAADVDPHDVLTWTRRRVAGGWEWTS